MSQLRRSLMLGVSVCCLGVASSAGDPVHPDLALSSLPAPSGVELQEGFTRPPATARPWVFWYWMHGAASKEGITADLESFKSAGLGGACLMFIKAPDEKHKDGPRVVQLSPEWWDLVGHAFKEAARLGLRLSMGSSDGFATAGGPWITPPLSMQRVTASALHINSDSASSLYPPVPDNLNSWYEDLKIVAFPSLGTPFPGPVRVSASEGAGPVSADLFLKDKAPVFRAEQAAWLQAEYAVPCTLRSVQVIGGGGAYQSNRLRVEASDDGVQFTFVADLEAPRHGWLDWDLPTTHAVPETTARFFRFSWSPEGSEPGGEDLDSAKWKPVLKLRGLRLSSEPLVHHREGKSAAVWRLASSTEERTRPDLPCLDPASVIDLSDRLRPDGSLDWTPPEGAWTVLRIGRTTTGHRNETGGGAKGLECDKLNPAAVSFQFEQWFGALLAHAGPALTPSVLDTFHVDSWECGSQNWSPVLPAEFLARRGYALEPWLPVLAGYPMISAARSEQFLQDFRKTIAELVNDNFYGTLATLVRERGLAFSGECTAPVMATDGLAHYGKLDIPMGEFWLRSPTHDKPNDLLDAVSGAHIYGKRLIQAEAFTELRTSWDEHPGTLKALGDLHFALGVNRMMLHVAVQTPDPASSPGHTMDRIGVCFQRGQPWWPQVSSWTDYLARSQYLLQQGTPVADIAVFTGEEIPSRAVLPGRLLATLPGLLGSQRVAREQVRLQNEGQPRRTIPEGVTASANLSDASAWVDPLHGYAYDSINAEALLRLARVENGRVVLPGGASYALLVLPRKDPLQPAATSVSLEFIERLHVLVTQGASVVLNERPARPRGLLAHRDTARFNSLVEALWGNSAASAPGVWRQLGEGWLCEAPWFDTDLTSLGIVPAIRSYTSADTSQPSPAGALAWTERALGDLRLFYLSNQSTLTLESFLLRSDASHAELWNPLDGSRKSLIPNPKGMGLVHLNFTLEPGASRFVVVSKSALPPGAAAFSNFTPDKQPLELSAPWSLSLLHSGEPFLTTQLKTLVSWSTASNPLVRHHSGQAVYESSFEYEGSPTGPVLLDLGSVANVASVSVNGIDCGTLWCPPYTIEISKALRPGDNTLRILVSNTWVNALLDKDRASGAPAPTGTNLHTPLALQAAGLLGPVTLTPLSGRPAPSK